MVSGSECAVESGLLISFHLCGPGVSPLPVPASQWETAPLLGVFVRMDVECLAQTTCELCFLLFLRLGVLSRLPCVVTVTRPPEGRGLAYVSQSLA